MSLVLHLRSLASYDAWATRAVLAECKALGKDKYRAHAGLCFRSIHGLLCHMFMGSKLWLHRVQGIPADNLLKFWDSDYAMPHSTSHAYESIFDSLEQVERNMAAQTVEWQALLEKWIDEDLAKDVSYVITSGEAASALLGVTVSHVFNHGIYHRGQITAAIYQLGGTPLSIDYTAFYFAERCKRDFTLRA
jgi:uncharacterized damage-inducible protein DinB